MMRYVRRTLVVLLIVAGVAGIVALERMEVDKSEGASAAIIDYPGFPMVPDQRRISSSWFCPGVAAGDGVEAGNIAIANPSETDISAAVTFMSDGEPESENVIVPARSRIQVESIRGRTVGVVVPVVEIIGNVGTVEQQLIYAAGDVTSQCTTSTAPEWLFADGWTVEGSSERIVVTNPYPESAVVNVTFTTREGKRSPANLQGLIVGPQRSRSLSMSTEGAEGEAVIAVQVTATTGKIIASRAQHYLGGGRLGYSTTLGVPRALTEWWFAAGRTGPNVSETLVVFNPNEEDESVTVVFFGDGISVDPLTLDDTAGITPLSTVFIPAGEVVVIDTNNVADLPKGDHAMLVSSVGGLPLVVEHVITQQTPRGTFTAITNGVPDELVSMMWRVPTGLLDGSASALAIVNTTGDSGTFSLSAIGPGGEFTYPEFEAVPLGPGAVVNLGLPAGAATGEIILRSTVGIVVQRRMNRGHDLPGFSLVSALPVQVRR
jgi:hypothetical protein